MTDLPWRPAVYFSCLLLGSFAPTLSNADDATGRPIVPGFERFYSAPETDPAPGGALLLSELNCTSCHQGDDGSSRPFARKQAPILDQVGSRIRREHLREYLANPRAAKPATTMPNLLEGLPKEEAEATVDALVHFLASTGSVRETPPNRKLVKQGQTLYEQSGCLACHGVVGDKSPPLATTVPIGDVVAKYSVDGLKSFVQDPLATRPSGRMPSLNLKSAEAQAVASYLLRDARIQTATNVAYRYFEGGWENLPDLDGLTPVSTGFCDGFDLEIARRHGEYALRFEGMIEVDRPGPYTFHLSSDDGSKIWVDDKLVADNDGIHATTHQAGRIELERGRHKVVVGFFQGDGEEELDVTYEGPGLPRRPLGPAILTPADAAQVPKAADVPPFVLDPAKVDKGRLLFASIGCASCHLLREGDKAVEPRPASKPLAELRPDAGCLAAETGPGVPDFDLSPRQRSALASALKPPATPKALTDQDVIHKTLVAFNCYGCHVRDGVGGVEEGRDSAFATTQKEMGDEGRIPPLLTGVGGKLTEKWLKHVLADGAKDRPYMSTRMPKFGEANVGHLVKPLETVDVVAPVPVPHFDESDKRVKATGRFIVGSQAFNCGSCHQFNDYQAAGIQALDMTLMTQRLRRDWFHRYVVDPPAFRPGTRMPSAWPGGKSQLDSIYGGDTTKQIESMWLYLSDGRKAAVPYGLGREPIPLVAEKYPVIYRNFIEGAGPRAIGVGFPTKSNLAFDANDLRLALIWQGSFIDASKHWVGRGEGFQGPLGDNILSLPAGPAFAILANDAEEWPRKTARELGQRFRGYELRPGETPVFLYDIGDVHMKDIPFGVVDSDKVPVIHRAIDMLVDKPVEGLYFRAALGKKIEFLGDGTYQVDGEWKVRIGTPRVPIIRESAGKTELIVPIDLENGRGRLVEEFTW